MSTRQLKAKAEGYGEYVQLEGWRERNEFCPPLLFITTSEKRARSFLATCDRAIGRRRMLVAATGLARDIGGALLAPEWVVGGGEPRADLLAILRGARRPHDQALERDEAERRREDVERDRLRSGPEALAERLRDELRRGWSRDRLGQTTTSALLLSAEVEGDLDTTERAAFEAVAGMLDEPLHVRLADREPTRSERAALDALVSRHRRTQLRLLEELAARFGEGPALRSRLDSDELLTHGDVETLPREAEQDRDARAKQERLREEHLSWRKQEAKRLAKTHGVIERRRIGRDAFLEQVDRRALGRCRRCEETAFPDPERASSHAKRHVAERCHYCGGGVSREIDPDEGPT